MIKTQSKRSSEIIKAIDPINVTHHMGQNLGLTVLTGLVMPAVPLSKNINVKAIQENEAKEKTSIRIIDNPLTRIIAAGTSAGLLLMTHIGQLTQMEMIQGIVPNWIENNSGNFLYSGAISVLASCLLSRFKYGAEAGVILCIPYFALCESVLPNLMPTGTPDYKDIPMAVIGATLSYLYFSRSYARHNRIK
jgi:hypothetical protein